VKSVTEISMAKHCKKQSCSVGGEHALVMKFREFLGMIEKNKLPSPVQFAEGLDSVDRGEFTPVTKFKRLKRVDNSNGPENILAEVAKVGLLDSQNYNDINDFCVIEIFKPN